MRFCPFCSAENADEQAVCQACGRRLPPLPPRRARNAPPTGVNLPPRPPVAMPPRPPTQPPPIVSSPAPGVPAAGVPAAGVPAGVPAATAPAVQQQPDADRQALLHAISPGPAAQRREAPASSDPDPTFARRASDAPAPNATPRPELVARGKSTTLPPPPPLAPVPPLGAVAAPTAGERSKPTTLPPPTPPDARTRQPTPPIPTARPAGARGQRETMPPPEPTVTPAPPVLPTEPAYPRVPRVGEADPGDPITIAARRIRSDASPPPTRLQRSESAERPFTPPKVHPVPEIPEPGLVNAAKYAVNFGRARWQRRGAIKTLGIEIKQDTEALDQVLGALGREARNAKVEGRVFSAENAAINAADERIAALGREHADVDARKADENSKFVDIERERNTKLAEAERLVEEAQRELAHLEGQRRAARDKRKEVERRQKAYLKNAEDAERNAGSAQMGEARSDLRRSADDFRKEAAALEPERQELDRKLAGLERPINEATAKLDAAKAELDAAKRSLHDAREGHTHRLAELDAEQKRKSREIALAEAEIQRRLVTLGTLVNLNRIEDPAFAELYQRIDRIRGAITARTTEIEKLTAEREAYDRGTLIRGVSTIGGAFMLFIAFLVILRAIL